MTWTYDPSLLGDTNNSDRLHSVRLLIGDTESTDPQVEDEEVLFALGQSVGNIYDAGYFLCRILAAKYARLVDTALDKGLSEKNDNLSKKYTQLSDSIKAIGRSVKGDIGGVSGGGIKISAMVAANSDPDRLKPQFGTNEFTDSTDDYRLIP
jgi:hypothetical protein